MSERPKPNLKLQFAPSVRLQFTGTEVSADAGVLLLREFDEKLGLTQALAEKLTDPRYPPFTDHSLRDLLRQYLYQIVQGYEDTNDAKSLRIDPALRLAVGKEDLEAPLASQPTLSRLENELLARLKNLKTLQKTNLEWVEIARRLRRQKRFTLDLDSFHDRSTVVRISPRTTATMPTESSFLEWPSTGKPEISWPPNCKEGPSTTWIPS